MYIHVRSHKQVSDSLLILINNSVSRITVRTISSVLQVNGIGCVVCHSLITSQKALVSL